MANVETEGFGRALRTVAELEDGLDDEMESFVDGKVEELREAIKDEIKRQGLVDSGALLASFKIERSGSEWDVYSTKEYATYLEFGTQSHTIRPDTEPVLAWQPENPADYGDKYDEETGYVYFTVVDHPGNDDYNFVRNAQIRWELDLAIDLRRFVEQQLIEAGYTAT